MASPAAKSAPRTPRIAHDTIVIRGAKEHNLTDVSLELPRDRLIVFTGLSGSGKSSLAFDTIYAEGQRRYVESLSSYARQFLGPDGQARRRDHRGAVAGHLDRPEVRVAQPPLHGRHRHRDLRLPASAVRPRRRAARPRDGRGAGPPDAPADRRPHRCTLPEGTRFQVLAPVVRGRKGTYEQLFEDLAKQGFGRVRVDGEVHELAGTSSSWPATSSTPSRSSSTASCCATASSAA